MTPKNQKPVEYKGVIYPSMTALAEHFELNLSTCQMRLKRGVPLTRPVHKGAMKPLEYEGVRYESVRDFAERNGIRCEVASACIDGIKGRWLDEREKD